MDSNEVKNKPKQTKKRKKRRRLPAFVVAIIYSTFVIGTSAVLAVMGWLWFNDLAALSKPDITASVLIEETDTLKDISSKLKEAGLINYTYLFELFGWISKAENKIDPGYYELSTNQDYRSIVASMKSRASKDVVTVTIPEGYEMDDIILLLSENGVNTYDKLIDTASNYNFEYSFLEDLPLGEANRLEGYLFPDTYDFYVGESTVTVINKMLSNFNKKFGSSMRDKADSLGMSINDIVILASMIEKETTGNDRYLISSVFHNRLTNPAYPYLQSCATVNYILGEKKLVLTDEETAIDSPYNTYKYPGLPIGAICCPGLDSLNAALYPAETQYYYFGLSSDGIQKFSKTYEEHLKAIK